MSSKAALRKCVEDIASAIEPRKSVIEREQKVLKNLFHSLREAQRHFEAFSPVARLPDEILSFIFQLCDGPGYASAAPSCAPLLLLRVCYKWREIVLSCPFLWTSVSFHAHTSGKKYAKLVSAWLGRSQALPLEIRLSGFVSDGTKKALEQHASRVRTLEIRGVFPQGTFLEHMTSFSSLQTLKLFGAVNVTISDYLHSLESAPLLTELGIASIDVETSEGMIAVIHTSLKILNLEEDEYSCPSFILRYLTLPMLETLTLVRGKGTNVHLRDFFTRSSPPLKHLSIGGFEDATQIDLGYLQLVPSLVDLSMACEGFDGVPIVCARMTSGLAPSLRHLSVTNQSCSLGPRGGKKLPSLLADYRCLCPHLELIRLEYFACGLLEQTLDQVERFTRGGILHVHLSSLPLSQWREVNEISCSCSRCRVQ
ncbi:hypothetical protein R3P38DRAFT_2872054 [Favolaschia claudopus]|uniref:F-box domain-containing protein n=1 Tax=Favolaschia claudopus TaxID=2862362 RepID=A0AAW0DEH3_9AGAR